MAYQKIYKRGRENSECKQTPFLHIFHTSVMWLNTGLWTITLIQNHNHFWITCEFFNTKPYPYIYPTVLVTLGQRLHRVCRHINNRTQCLNDSENIFLVQMELCARLPLLPSFFVYFLACHSHIFILLFLL